MVWSGEKGRLAAEVERVGRLIDAHKEKDGGASPAVVMLTRHLDFLLEQYYVLAVETARSHASRAGSA